MYEALLKATPEYKKIAASFAKPGPAALFGLPPAGRALLYAALQKDLGRVLCIVTPGEAEATHFADDLKALGLAAAVFPPRDFMLRPERRLCARRGPFAVHSAPGRILEEHPHPQARHGVQPRSAGGPAVCRRVCAAQPGGRPRPVQRARRHRRHLRAGHAPARPRGVLGRRDRLHFFVRPAHPAAGYGTGKNLSFPCPRGAVRRHGGDRRSSARRREKGPGQAPHRAGKGHRSGPRPAGFRPDAGSHG